MSLRRQTPPCDCPAIRMNLLSIDWILRRLVALRQDYPDRAGELAGRIDAALDERLRLMRLRDGTLPIPTKHTQSHR